MFMADFAGVRVLYTGDYSREEDCHLCAAEIPQFSLIFAELNLLMVCNSISLRM